MSTRIATIARFAGTLLLLFFTAFLFGEDPPNPLRFTTRESLFAAGLFALYGGLALAWYRALWGGLLSLAGFIYLAVLSGTVPLDWPLFAPAAVGLANLIGSRARPAPPSSWSPKMYLPFALIALLCVNEMFGDPPFPSALNSGSGNLHGTWSGGQVLFNIAPDNLVTGEIGPNLISSARLSANRSWFGRLMNWRTDYRVRGTLAGGQSFSVLLNADASNLDGTVEISGQNGHSRVQLARISR